MVLQRFTREEVGEIDINILNEDVSSVREDISDVEARVNEGDDNTSTVAGNVTAESDRAQGVEESIQDQLDTLDSLNSVQHSNILSSVADVENLLNSYVGTANALLEQEVVVGTIVSGTGAEIAVIAAPASITITGARLVNAADLPADAVNYTTLELINKGTDGTGNTVLCTFDGSAESMTAFVACAKSCPSTVLPAGTVLTLKKTDSGGGAQVTNLLVLVKYNPM
jgi:hypothetical protein